MPSTSAQKARDAARFMQITRRTLDEMKVSAGCVDCGFNRWPEALQFDHIDPRDKLKSDGWVDDRSKLVNLTRLRRYIDHVERTCEIRCANCHAHRTKTERHWLPSESLAADRERLTLFDIA